MKKVVVITGASSGVGEELSKHFIKNNDIVIGLARNIEKLRYLADILGPYFVGIETNVTNILDVQYAFRIIKQNYSNIDILINNAAVFKMDNFANHTYNDIDSIIDTNLKGTIYCTLEAVKIMEKNSFHRIINIASVSGMHGIKNQSIYCASKYGVRGFADALSQELKDKNISITTILPGGIDTPLWNENNPYPGENKDSMLSTNDIVNTVKYICDSRNNVLLKEIIMFPNNEWH